MNTATVMVRGKFEKIAKRYADNREFTVSGDNPLAGRWVVTGVHVEDRFRGQVCVAATRIEEADRKPSQEGA